MLFIFFGCQKKILFWQTFLVYPKKNDLCLDSGYLACRDAKNGVKFGFVGHLEHAKLVYYV